MTAWTDRTGKPVKPDPRYGWKWRGHGPWITRSSDKELAEAEKNNVAQFPKMARIVP